MTNDELNKYIRNYLEHDQTHSAIMLTAPWGSGKSYYIQNELIPFLEKEENGKHLCVVISLYGLNSLYDISKALYMETRIKALTKKGEKAALGKIAAKTILKGVTSFFGIGISTSPEELQELYESIDLSNRLIVLEDLERSRINITELLGYINNLVEQDGVKVLIVANEDAIVEYEPLNIDNQKEKKNQEILDKLTGYKDREYTKQTKEYLRIKEKTISDTIFFEGDFCKATSEILSKWQDSFMRLLSYESIVKNIQLIFRINGSVNLRILVFACQKTHDLFQIFKDNLINYPDFVEAMLYGNIYMSCKLKNDEEIQWGNDQLIYIDLFPKRYPIFRFCWNYLTCQIIDKANVLETKESFLGKMEYDKRNDEEEKNLNILYEWYLHSENEVKEAIEAITRLLDEQSTIPFCEYDRLAYYLIKVEVVLGFDVDEAKKRIIINLSKNHDNNDSGAFSLSVSEEDTDEFKDKYMRFLGEMKKCLIQGKKEVLGFDYDPAKIPELLQQVTNNKSKVKSSAFALRFDQDKFVKMLNECSPADIQSLRDVFLTVYTDINSRQFYKEDINAIEVLIEKLRMIDYNNSDKIKQLQIGWFIDNLSVIHTNLCK